MRYEKVIWKKLFTRHAGLLQIEHRNISPFPLQSRCVGHMRLYYWSIIYLVYPCRVRSWPPRHYIGYVVNRINYCSSNKCSNKSCFTMIISLWILVTNNELKCVKWNNKLTTLTMTRSGNEIGGIEKVDSRPLPLNKDMFQWSLPYLHLAVWSHFFARIKSARKVVKSKVFLFSTTSKADHIP